MQIETTTKGSQQNIASLCATHKTHLANKYAFLICQELINKVKNNKFTKPPKRVVEELDAKLEAEANTSASSGESVEALLEELKSLPPLAAEQQPETPTSKKLMEVFLALEEWLQTLPSVASESLVEAQRLNRAVLSHVLAHGPVYRAVPTEKLALAGLVLCVESVGADKQKVVEFIQESLGQKRITSLAQIKGSRAYYLLSKALGTTSSF